jgi:hypothetical protein
MGTVAETVSIQFKSITNFLSEYLISDRLCGLVVRVLGYRSRGPGSIPGTTIFSER